MSQLTTSAGRASVVDDPEIGLAREIEASLVPPRCYGWSGAQVAARRIASAGLGGDFHDVVPGPAERYSLVVGTVSGPGIFAALAKAALSGAVRKFGRTGPSPCAMVTHLQSLLERINAGLRAQRVVCSMFHGLVDCSGRTLEYCNIGHCRTFMRSQSGEIRDLPSSGPVMGSREHLEYESLSFDLETMQRLMVASDGLVTACSASGESFGAARGRCLITDTARLPADEQVDAIVRTLRDHVGPNSMLTEDATIFVTEFAERVSPEEPDPVKALLWGREFGNAAVPDPSVFLG